MYKRIIFFVLLWISLSSCFLMNPQKSYYKTTDQNDLLVLDSNYYYSSVLANSIESTSYDTNGLALVKKTSQAGVLESIESFADLKNRRYAGESKYYYPNGKLKRTAIYGKNSAHLKIKTYYPNGIMRRDDEYLADSLIRGVCYDSLGKEIEYTDYAGEPEVDMSIFQRCIVYPENLRRENREEDLLLTLFVSKYNKIIAIKYDNRHSREFFQTAINCLKSLNKNSTSLIKAPLSLDNEPTDCWVTIPVRFRIR